MRLGLALLITFCLLFQQAVVAATVCDMSAAPAAKATMMPEHCAGMDMARDWPGLCRSHCAPDLAVVPDYTWPPVHFVAMEPPPIDLLSERSLADPGAPKLVAVHRSDPPPRLRYCRLLI
jgi:hypothetical protein